MVIDYPYTDLKSDFMDIFLVANCEFIFGSTSGGTDIALMFDTPHLIVSVSIIGRASYGKQSVYIPIKLKEVSTQRVIPYYECLEKRYDQCTNANQMHDWGIEFVQSTNRDILKATREMVARLEGTFSYSQDEVELLNAYFEKYWVNTYAANVKSPIGIEFLKENRDLFIKKT